MAQMNTQTIVITVSELLPNNAEASQLFDSDTVSALKQAIEEMVGEGKLVEIEG